MHILIAMLIFTGRDWPAYCLVREATQAGWRALPRRPPTEVPGVVRQDGRGGAGTWGASAPGVRLHAKQCLFCMQSTKICTTKKACKALNGHSVLVICSAL